MKIPVRALPRLFLPGADLTEPVEIPKEEVDKLRKVLRLGAGSEIGVLPNDGTLVRCEFRGHMAIPLEVIQPNTEPDLHLTVAQALPKGDKLDEIIRSCTEIGVSKFILFASERTVVRWDEKKTSDRLRRLSVIAREACEISFRTRLPEFEVLSDLKAVLKAVPDAIVLSEVEGIQTAIAAPGTQGCIVVGPEGGWAKEELVAIGNRGISLGPRVLRVDHAAAAAAAMLLLKPIGS